MLAFKIFGGLAMVAGVLLIFTARTDARDTVAILVIGFGALIITVAHGADMIAALLQAAQPKRLPEPERPWPVRKEPQASKAPGAIVGPLQD